MIPYAVPKCLYTTVPSYLKLVGETSLKEDLFALYSHGFCVFQLALYLLAVSHSVCALQFPLIWKYLDGEMVQSRVGQFFIFMQNLRLQF